MAHAIDFHPLIAAAAQRTGLDWWLLYGVIEQESGFVPTSVSPCGALGLMQLMPSSFPTWPSTSLLDPVNNVKLGAEFLRECIAMWKRESSDEAIQFGLACYNGGAGYALAAQRQAVEQGADGSQWERVAPFLAEISVGGKTPDVQQITEYVRVIWRKFRARRGTPIPV